MLIRDKKEISIWDIDGVLIDELTNTLRGRCTRDMIDPCLSFEEYGYDGEVEVFIKYQREETDKEVKDRQEVEEMQRFTQEIVKQKKEQEERKFYEELKKKYG